MKTKTEQATAYWPTPWTLRGNTDGSATADIFDANECGITTLDIRLAPKVVQAVNEWEALNAVAIAAEKARLTINPLLVALPYGHESLDIGARKVQEKLRIALATLSAIRAKGGA